jgi:hypothetical protein
MTVYEIRVKGHLDQRWSMWFERKPVASSGYLRSISECSCTVRAQRCVALLEKYFEEEWAV